MDAKRVAVALSLSGMVASNCFAPAPAFAQDALMLTGIAIGAYAGTLVAGTAVYRSTEGPFGFAPGPPNATRRPPPKGLRLAPQCRQSVRRITLVCW